MVILGIETSCDETAASVVRDGKEMLSNVIASSMDLHTMYGGVVPEIAARSHIESIIPVIDQALAEAFGQSKTENNTSPSTSYQLPTSNFDLWSNIDGIAVTYGAGLGGSLLVGVMTARTLALTKNKPLYGINHVEAHVYANFLTSSQLPGYKLPDNSPEFPLLAIIVSGGHTQLVLFRDHFDYMLLGRTRDDAIGEAFDKVAKILGLPYPGGPSIARAALDGDAHKFKLPKAKLDQGAEILDFRRKILDENPQITNLKSNVSYDFSFSGLKTAVLRLAQEQIGEDFTFPSFKVAEKLSELQKADIAASFQRIAIETIVDKAVLACEEFQPKSVVIAGGVAANQELRRQLSERLPVAPSYTDIKLCTDNGAIVAALGCFKAMLKAESADPYTLAIQPNLTM